METIYRNTDDGIEARIMEGNDADETITIRFCDDYSRCLEYAKKFFIDGYTTGE
jgi:hypothetical protein